MVGTRSTRRRMAQEKHSDYEASSMPRVLARIQLRPPRKDKQDLLSEVTSPIADVGEISGYTEYYNDHVTEPEIRRCDQSIDSLSDNLTGQHSMMSTSSVGKDMCNDIVLHGEQSDRARGSMCNSEASSPEKISAADQLFPAVLDDICGQRTHSIDRSSRIVRESLHRAGDTDEVELGLESTEDGNEQPADYEDPFAWLVQTGEMIVIDPEDTIPLTRIREVSKSGLAKLEQPIQGTGSGLFRGMSSAASQAVVVSIPDDHLHIVRSYFVNDKGLAEENAYAISIYKRWYGIVDGGHRRKFLLLRIARSPKLYKGKGWTVLLVDWQPLDVLRAFARARNELQRGENLVDFTVYDVFKNLKQCAAEVALRLGMVSGCDGNRGFIKKVADHYCGGADSANNFTRQLAGIAVVLSWPVITVMGEILNKEYSVEGAGYDPDTRLCRNLFSRSTFRGATTFKTAGCEEDQINTMRRLELLAPSRNYKPVTKAELEVQVEKVIAASSEVKKMESKLQGHEWPTEMEMVKQTLLMRTTLDGHVEQNKDSNELLPTFQELWKANFPLAAEFEAANRGSNTVDSGGCSSPTSNDNGEIFDALNDSHVDTPNCAQPNDKSRTSEQHSAVEEQQNSTHSEQSVDAQCITPDASGKAKDPLAQSENLLGEEDIEGSSPEDAVEEENLCPLKQLSIRAENKSWRDFQVNLHVEDLFDFIYADPQQSLSASEVKEGVWTEFKDERRILEFARFCSISLRPGCYCFVFLIAAEHSAWLSAFQKQGMKVMSSPFLVIPSHESARVTRLKELPQPLGELAIVARTPGTCPGFKVNFNRPYNRIASSHTRKFGIIDNVPRCVNPLRANNSRVEVRPRERHPDFISEIMDTFCAPTGLVLDPFGGALTTAVSSVPLSENAWF